MKTQTQIRQRLAELHAQLDDTVHNIIDLRAECTHPDAVFEYSADTGNYSEKDDRYWKDWICNDCGKFWKEDITKTEWFTSTVVVL